MYNFFGFLKVRDTIRDTTTTGTGTGIHDSIVYRYQGGTCKKFNPQCNLLRP